MWLQLTLSHLATQSGNSQRQFLAVAEGCEELPNGRGTAGARLGHGWGMAGASGAALDARPLGRSALAFQHLKVITVPLCGSVA